MRVAVVSESPADEAAIKILVDAIAGRETELVSTRLRPSGWPHVLEVLPGIIKALHYDTLADCIAVVVDSDHSPVHDGAHNSQQQPNHGCRLCLLRSCIQTTLSRVSAVPNRDSLKTAVGLAVPAIEAWYRCGLDAHVNEARWIGHLSGEKINFNKKSLKVDVYGCNQPSLQVASDAAVLAATRLTSNLEQLREFFPNGFNCFYSDIRNW
jgi:hypothetical protein